MNIEQLNRLLNVACEIITSLEQYADDSLRDDIDALFNEIRYSDELDADMEAQDWHTFKENKI